MAQSMFRALNGGAPGNQAAASDPANFAEEERERNRRRRAATHDLLVELDALVPKSQQVKAEQSRRGANPRLRSSRSMMKLLKDTLMHVQEIQKPHRQAAARAGGSVAPEAVWSISPGTSGRVISPAETEGGMRKQMLLDPNNSSLVHPELLTAGLRLAEGVGMFAVDLSQNYRVLEWNRAMEEMSVPAGLAQTMPLRFIVEHWPETYFAQLETTSKSLPEGGQRFILGQSLDLALMNRSPSTDREGRLRVVVRYNPVRVAGVWMTKKAGRVVLAVVCELGRGDICGSPVSFEDTGSSSLAGTPVPSAVSPDIIKGEYSMAAVNGEQKINMDYAYLNLLHSTLATASEETAGRMRRTMDRILSIVSTGMSAITSFGLNCGVAMASPFLKATMALEDRITFCISIDVCFPKYLGGFKFPGFIQSKHTLDGVFDSCVALDGPRLVMESDAAQNMIVAFCESKPSLAAYPNTFLSLTAMMYKGKSAEESTALKQVLNGFVTQGPNNVNVSTLIDTRLDLHFSVNPQGQVQSHTHVMKTDGRKVTHDIMHATQSQRVINVHPGLQDLILSPNNHEIRVRAWSS